VKMLPGSCKVAELGNRRDEPEIADLETNHGRE
jgi:hypothetical protein